MHWVGSMKRKRMTEEERRVAHCRSQAAHKARGSLVGGQSSARRRPEAPPSLIWMPMPTQPWASSSSSSAAACDDVAAVVPSPVADFISAAVPVAVAADVVDDVVDEVEADDVVDEASEVEDMPECMEVEGVEAGDGGEVRGGEGEGGGGEGGGVEGGGGEGGGGGIGGGGLCPFCADVAGG